MSTLTRFDVRITGLRADLTGSADAYVKLNFDEFKSHSTDVVKNAKNPSWPDEVSFQYETRYPDKLHLKILELKVMDKGFLGSSAVGSVQLDLHTIATGSVRHIMPIRDGSRTRGRLVVDVEMRQVAHVAVNLQNLEFTASTSHSGVGPSDLFLAYASTTEADIPRATVDCPKGQARIPYGDRLFFNSDLAQLATCGVRFWLKAKTGRWGSAEALCETFLPYTDVLPATSGEVHSFDLVFVGRISGNVRGKLYFEKLPTFVQMKGGYHTDTGLYDAVSPVWAAKVPNKPRCTVHPPAHLAAAAGSGAGGSAGHHPPVSGHATGHAVPPASGHAVGHVVPPPGSGTGFVSGTVHGGAAAGAGAAVGASHYGRVPSGHAPPAPAPAPTPARTVPASPHRSRDLSMSLPPFWTRRVDETGRSYFMNHIYKGTVWKLPTAREFEIVFVEPPPLGLELEPCTPSSLVYGLPEGDPIATADVGAIVKSVNPSGQAAAIPDIKVGHRIVGIAGQRCTSMTFAQTLALLSRQHKPLLTITFRDPYAVDAAVAEYCKDTRNLRTPAAGAGLAVNPAEWHTRTDQYGPYYVHVSGRVSRTWPPQ